MTSETTTMNPDKSGLANILPDYSEKIDTITEWLEEAKRELQRAPAVIQDDIEKVKIQFNNHENFITRLMGKQSEVFNLLKTGKAMLEANLAMDKEDQRAMIDKMKKLNNLWEGIRVETLEYQSKLQNALNTLQKIQIQTFEDWLCNMERIVRGDSHIHTEKDMSPADKEELIKQFDVGTQLIKPLSNMLVVVDSEEDQEYKSLEEKLASLQTRYIKVCQWLDLHYNKTLGPQLKTISQLIQSTSNNIVPTSTSSTPANKSNKYMEESGVDKYIPILDNIKHWATDTLSHLEKLLDYSYNPHVWEPNELPDLDIIQDEYTLNEKELKNIIQQTSQTIDISKVPELAKMIENVDRGLDYIKFKIEKIRAHDQGGKMDTSKSTMSTPTIFKKIKLENAFPDSFSAKDSEKVLGDIPLLESSGKSYTGPGHKLNPRESFKIQEEVITPKIPTIEPVEMGETSTKMDELTAKRDKYKERIPSIEITKVKDDDEYEAPIIIAGDNQRIKDANGTRTKVLERTPSLEEQEKELFEIPEHLSKKRESLGVPTEFPELDSNEGEKQWETAKNMSDEAPIPSSEKLHIGIYDINEALREIEYWFRDAKDKPKFNTVNESKEFTEAVENCSAKLDQIKSIWPKIEETRNMARTLANLEDGKNESANAILKDSNDLIHRWEGLFEQTNNYFESLVNMLEAYHYQSFQEPLTSLNNWLDNVKSSLISDPNKYAPPEILTEKLAKVKEFQCTIDDQSPTLASIRSIWDEKSAEENFKFSMRDKFQKDIENVVAKYESVKELADESSKELESRLTVIKNFLEEINVLKSWMNDLKRILDTEDKSGFEPSSPKIKEEEIKSLQENIDVLKPSLDNVNRITSKIVENADIDFAKSVRDDVQELNTTWKQIIAQADKDKSFFNYDEYNDYMDKLSNDLNKPSDISSEDDLKAQISRLNNLKDDLQAKKSNFYSNLPSGLYPEGAIPPAQEQQLNTKFKSLMDKLVGRIDFYKTSLTDYDSFKKDIGKFMQKLKVIQNELEVIRDSPSKKALNKTQKNLISNLADPSIQSLHDIPNSLKRNLSNLREKATVLSRNKIMPTNVESEYKLLENTVKSLMPLMEKKLKLPKIEPILKTEHVAAVPISSVTKPSIPFQAVIPTAAGLIRKKVENKAPNDSVDSIQQQPPQQLQQSKSELVDESNILPTESLSPLDRDLLKLQEWIVHEDVMIMNHLDNESKAKDLPEQEYQNMLRDFEEKDALLNKVADDVDKLDDKAKRGQILNQLNILKNRFDELRENMENFEFPDQIGSKLKTARITLKDIGDEINEITPENCVNHDPKSTKEILDRCMKNCFRLTEFKNNFEDFTRDVPRSMTLENDNIKRSLDRKIKDCSDTFNTLADEANAKKDALEKKLSISEEFHSALSPVTHWLEQNEPESDKRKQTFNINFIDKEMAYLDQMDAELQKCHDTLNGISNYLNHSSKNSEFREPKGTAIFVEPAIPAFKNELKHTEDRLKKFKNGLDSQKHLYKDMENDYGQFRDSIAKINSWIDKSQNVINATPNLKGEHIDMDPLDCEKNEKSLQNLRREVDEEIMPEFNRAQTLGSKLIDNSDNFRMLTRSEITSSKKQLDDIIPELDKRIKDFATLFARKPVTSAGLDGTPKSFEQDISFTIAKINDFSQGLDPSALEINLPSKGIGTEAELKAVLDPRIKALEKEYGEIETHINDMTDKINNKKAKLGNTLTGISPSLVEEFDKARHTWIVDVKPKALQKLENYKGLDVAWKSFVRDYSKTWLFLLNRLETTGNQQNPQNMENLKNLMKENGVKSVDELKSFATYSFSKTELRPLTESLITDLQNLANGRPPRKDSQISYSSIIIPKTPPPSPSNVKAGDRFAGMFATGLTAASVYKSLKGEGTSQLPTNLPYKYDDVEPGLIKGRSAPTTDSGQDYSQEPYEFLWEISNIQGLVDKMLEEMKDPDLDNFKVQAHPVRRHTLESIEETINEISPGIYGSEQHKKDVLKNVKDPMIADQIEQSLIKLKSDWNTLNSKYALKMQAISKSPKSEVPTSNAQSHLTKIPLTKVATKFSPEKYYKAGPEEPAEALALVNNLQGIAHWLRHIESLANTPIPLFNESALRSHKQTFKDEEINFPEKYRLLERSETSLADIKRTCNLAPEKIDKIAHLIAQAKEKYHAILADFNNKNKEIDDSFHRIFHFNQQIDGLANWLKSTRDNVEKSLSSLNEEDVNNLHSKMDEHQPDYDQLNYTFVQLVNEGLRYNELYDIDEFSCPDNIRNQMKSLNEDWSFLRDIDPKNVAKTAQNQKLQDTEPNFVATWPKLQQDLYNITDKINMTENALSTRIVDIISPEQINQEISNLNNVDKEVKKLKAEIDHILKVGNPEVLIKAGYDIRQAKEADEKCQELLQLVSHRIETLQRMGVDCGNYLAIYQDLIKWITVNAPILNELVEVKDKNHVTPAEFEKNHAYLRKKVPTYGKVVHDLDTIARKMLTLYSDDDSSKLKAKHDDISKLWYLVAMQTTQRTAKHIIPVIAALGHMPTTESEKENVTSKPTLPILLPSHQQNLLAENQSQSSADTLDRNMTGDREATNSYPLSPADLKEFRQQMENFKKSLVVEECALEAINKEVDKVMKDRDETQLNIWLDQIKEFQRDLEGHRVGYNILNQNGRKVLRDPSLVTSKEEAAQLRYKLDEINGKWENLRSKSNSLRNSLEEHYNPHSAIDHSIDEATAWVVDKTNHLDMMKPLGGDVNTLRHQLDEIASFNEKIDEKRLPTIQDVIKNGQAYLNNVGYYKIIERRGENLPPNIESKIKEGQEIEGKIVNLDQKWCDVIDNSIQWEATVTDMLKKMDDFNMDVASVAVDLERFPNDIKEIECIKSQNPSLALTKYKNLLESLRETQPKIHDINGGASFFLTRGLYLSKENDQRLQKLNDTYEILSHDIQARIKELEQPKSSPHFLASGDVIKNVKQLPLSPGTDSLKTSTTYKTSEPASVIKSKDSALPSDWVKAYTDAGVPYFIDVKTEKTYWDHPLMMEILKSLSETNYIKYAAYRTAMKLRILQKRLFLYLLNMGTAIDIMDNNNLRGKNDQTIGVSDVHDISKSIYNTLAQDNPNIVTNIPLSTDLYVDWLLDVYDSNRTGRINVLSLKVATILLCRAHLNDKYRYLYQLVADQYGNVTKQKLASLLREMLRIPAYLGEVSSFGGIDPSPSVENCFALAHSSASKRRNPESPLPNIAHHPSTSASGTTTVTASDFIRWTDKDPQSIVWLPVLYRLAAAETARHQSKCNICKMYPIIGFRYRCLKCLNFDICQFCFFQGKKYKQHKPSHPLHEYSTPTTTGEDVKDLTKTLRNKLRPRRYFVTHPRLGYTPINSQTGGGGSNTAPQSNPRPDSGSLKSSSYYRDDRNGPGKHISPEMVPLMPLDPGTTNKRTAPAGNTDRSQTFQKRYSNSGKTKEYSNDKYVDDRTELLPYNFDVDNSVNLNSDEEHKRIQGFVKSLSSTQPSPCISKKSVDNSDLMANQYDQRMREIERGSCTLKLEYEQLMKLRNLQNYENRSLNGEKCHDAIIVKHEDGCRDRINVLTEEGYGQSILFDSNENISDQTRGLYNYQTSPILEETYRIKNKTLQEFPQIEKIVNAPRGNANEDSDPTKKSLLLVTDNLQRALGDLVCAVEGNSNNVSPINIKNSRNISSPLSPPATVQPCR